MPGGPNRSPQRDPTRITGQVPIHAEQQSACMLTSANTCRTGRSVLEAAVGQPIVHFEDLRLTSRVLASKGEEADLVPIQIDLTTNQAVGPDLPQRPGLTEQDDLA